MIKLSIQARSLVAGGAVVIAACSEPVATGSAPQYVPSPASFPLTGTYPVNGAIGVPLSGPIRAQFWEATDPDMLTNISIEVREDLFGPAVPGTLSRASRVVSFVPTIPFLPGRNYRATVTSSARTAGAYVVGGAHSWTFNVRQE